MLTYPVARVPCGANKVNKKSNDEILIAKKEEEKKYTSKGTKIVLK